MLPPPMPQKHSIQTRPSTLSPDTSTVPVSPLLPFVPDESILLLFRRVSPRITTSRGGWMSLWTRYASNSSCGPIFATCLRRARPSALTTHNATPNPAATFLDHAHQPPERCLGALDIGRRRMDWRTSMNPRHPHSSRKSQPLLLMIKISLFSRGGGRATAFRRRSAGSRATTPAQSPRKIPDLSALANLLPPAPRRRLKFSLRPWRLKLIKKNGLNANILTPTSSAPAAQHGPQLNGHQPMHSSCFVHSHLDKGASLTDWLCNIQTHCLVMSASRLLCDAPATTHTNSNQSGHNMPSANASVRSRTAWLATSAPPSSRSSSSTSTSTPAASSQSRIPPHNRSLSSILSNWSATSWLLGVHLLASRTPVICLDYEYMTGASITTISGQFHHSRDTHVG
ncbi:hypothetical protein BDZ89DRAFT_1213102 [Hymenopellis radicata]|nr:hypothetical protein BDZ89DRAFT_1213102 [Hymenopellis radicata]